MNNKILEYNQLSIDITYQDTDIAGMVYFANYFNYAEKARSKFLKALLGYTKINQDINWVVKNVHSFYYRPVTIDSLLDCYTTIFELKYASLIFLHEFYHHNNLVQKQTVHLCCLNASLKPIKIPKEIMDILKTTRDMENKK